MKIEIEINIEKIMDKIGELCDENEGLDISCSEWTYSNLNPTNMIKTIKKMYSTELREEEVEKIIDEIKSKCIHIYADYSSTYVFIKENKLFEIY